MNKKPAVLFVCVHNAGRSQMAAGFMREIGGGKVEVLSAGSAPKESINPIAVQAMAEVGIHDIRIECQLGKASAGRVETLIRPGHVA